MKTKKIPIKKKTTIKKKTPIKKVKKRTKKELQQYKETRYLVRHFYRIQEHRIAMGGQIRSLKTDKLNTKPLDYYYEQLEEMEKRLIKELTDSIKEEPIWTEYLKGVKGIGPIIAAVLINTIDIKKAQYPSSLWKLAGQTPDSKRQKGKKLDYNPDLKMTMYKIAKSFLMSGSPYRRYYDQRKKLEEQRNKKRPKTEKLTKLHIHRRSNRWMIKFFLRDLYLNWRELEGLPVSEPYVIAKLHHEHDSKLDLDN